MGKTIIEHSREYRPKWLSANYYEPENNTKALVCVQGDTIFVTKYKDGQYIRHTRDADIVVCNVTRWCYLPCNMHDGTIMYSEDALNSAVPDSAIIKSLCSHNKHLLDIVDKRTHRLERASKKVEEYKSVASNMTARVAELKAELQSNAERIKTLRDKNHDMCESYGEGLALKEEIKKLRKRVKELETNTNLPTVMEMITELRRQGFNITF